MTGEREFRDSNEVEKTNQGSITLKKETKGEEEKRGKGKNLGAHRYSRRGVKERIKRKDFITNYVQRRFFTWQRERRESKRGHRGLEKIPGSKQGKGSYNPASKSGGGTRELAYWVNSKKKEKGAHPGIGGK